MRLQRGRRAPSDIDRIQDLTGPHTRRFPDFMAKCIQIIIDLIFPHF